MTDLNILDALFVTIDIIFISPQSDTVNAKINETIAFECITNVTGYTIGFSISEPDVMAQVYTEPLPGGGQKAFANVKVSADTYIQCGALDGFHLVDVTKAVHIVIRGNTTVLFEETKIFFNFIIRYSRRYNNHLSADQKIRCGLASPTLCYSVAMGGAGD